MSDPGPTSERLEALQARWESDKSSRVFLQLADEYRRLGRVDEAVRVLEEGLAETPRHPAAQVALGRCQLELGRAEAATVTLEQVIQSDPTQMVAYRLLVDAYVTQGKAVEARQRLQVYSLLNDADPDIGELRRKIGLLERQAEPEAEPAPTEPAAEAAEAVPAPPVPAEPAEPVPPAEPAGIAAPEPFGDLEPPPIPAPAAPEAAELFPDLAAKPSAGTSAGPMGEDLFGLAPPAASEPEPAIEPFALEEPERAPAPDLSVLLGGEAGTATPEPVAEAEEAVLEAPAPPEPELSPEEAAAAPEEVPEPPPPFEEEAFELVAEDEEPVGVEAPEPAPTGEAPPPPPLSEGRPTVTLGLLYLRQGHTREAEEIFHAVLEREPDNAEALRHLEAIGDQLRAELGKPRRVTAADLLEGWKGDPDQVGTTGRKKYVLERYGERLRGRAPGDVH